MFTLGAPPLVADFAVLTIGAAILGYVCQRIGLESIVGFLIAGAIVGPNALEVIKDPELVEGMGEIGVIFLMFAIGLELSADRLRKMGALMLGLHTVAQSILVRQLGSVDEATLGRVCVALNHALGC